MIVGLILLGSVLGAGAALAALILGAPVWMALVIHSATGVLGVLGVLAVAALRATPGDGDAPARPRAPARPQARITPG